MNLKCNLIVIVFALGSVLGAGSSQQPVAEPNEAAPRQQDRPVATDLGDPLPKDALVRFGTVRLRHDGGVGGVAFSPDGKMLGSHSADGIRLWDSATGKPIGELRAPMFGARCIAFSPDGAKLASGEQKKTVRLWDVRTGKMIFEKAGHVEEISGVAFAPDGFSFASVGGDIRVWNAMTGAEIHHLQPPGTNRASRQGLAYSPDGKLLAASRDVNIHVWDARTGVSRLVIPKAYRRDIIFTIFQDNHTLITSESGHIRFWDAATGKQIREFNPKGTGYVASIALSADGKLLARTGSKKIEILNAYTGETVQVFPDYVNHFSDINHVAFSPDGTILAAKAADNVVRVWDIKSGQRRLVFDVSHVGRINAAGFSPDGRHALTAGNEGTVRVWDTATGKQVCVFHLNDSNPDAHCGETIAAYSTDGKWIAAGCYERSMTGPFRGELRGLCKVWDATTGKEVSVQRFPQRVSHLAFAPTGQRLAIAIWDAEDRMRPEKRTVHVWPFLAGKEPIEVAEVGELGSDLHGVAFSANGKSLTTVGQRSIRTWDPATKKQQATFDLPAEAIFAGFSPDAKWVVSAGGITFGANDTNLHGDQLFVVEAASGRLLSTIKSPHTFRNIAALSSDGRIMASCQMTLHMPSEEFEYALRLWETATGKQVLALRPGTWAVSTLAFSADGRSLISGMNNGTALLWNARPTLVKALSPQELERLWNDLASKDAAEPYAAICSFAAVPETSVPFLKDRLLSPPDMKTVRVVDALIVDLGSGAFARRQAATAELTKLGDTAAGPLRQALAGKLSLEMRRRVETLLTTAGEVRPGLTLRRLRAIQALEAIGTPDARQVLQTMADISPANGESEEAKASVGRLRTRLTAAR